MLQRERSGQQEPFLPLPPRKTWCDDLKCAYLQGMRRELGWLSRFLSICFSRWTDCDLGENAVGCWEEPRFDSIHYTEKNPWPGAFMQRRETLSIWTTTGCKLALHKPSTLFSAALEQKQDFMASSHCKIGQSQRASSAFGPQPLTRFWPPLSSNL